VIGLEDVLYQHSTIIAATGGSDGVRDVEILKSAISRPFQTFDGKDLYPAIIEKAAALLESLLQNHPFVDGNKRTGYSVMRTFLIVNGWDIDASEDEKYNFVVSIASGEKNYDDILDWLITHHIILS
jgi:death-on-curing protein